MKLYVTSLFVDNQEKALQFYTNILGFEKSKDIPLGGDHRWLTVKSKQQTSDVELLLEPATHPAVGPYRQALRNDKIPLLSLLVDAIDDEYQRLVDAGVEFTQVVMAMGTIKSAVFDDTCGNLVQLVQL